MSTTLESELVDPSPGPAGLRQAPVVLAILLLTCALSLLQVLARPLVDLHAPLEVRPGSLSRGEIWRPLTANLVHWYGLPHLAANMFGLAVAGPPVERAYGRLGFVAIYGISGWVAWAAHSLWGRPGSGASAAVVGVYAALLVYFVPGYDRSPATRRVAIVGGLLASAWLFSGPVLDGLVLPGGGTVDIADDVHVVGFIAGLVVSFLLLVVRRARGRGAA